MMINEIGIEEIRAFLIENHKDGAYYFGSDRVTELWQPIETAPDGELVVVGWLDADDHLERRDFDYKEDGGWAKHGDLYQEFCSVSPPGSRGPREQAPYTHWLAVPPIPEAPNK